MSHPTALQEKVLKTLRKVAESERDADLRRLLRSDDATKEAYDLVKRHGMAASDAIKLRVWALLLEAQFHSLDGLFLTAPAEPMAWGFAELERADTACQSLLSGAEAAAAQPSLGAAARFLFSSSSSATL